MQQDARKARDAQWLAQIRSGDRVAFERMAVAYSPPLECHIRRKLGGDLEQLSSDIAQDCWVALAKSLRDDRLRHIWPFLVQVANNKVADCISRARKNRKIESISIDTSVEIEAKVHPGVDRAALRARLDDAIGRLLTEREKTAIRARFYERTSVRDWTGRLGGSPASWRKASDDAIQKLRIVFARDVEMNQFIKEIA